MRIIIHSLSLIIVILMLNGCFFSQGHDQKWEIEPKGSSAFALNSQGTVAFLYSNEKQLMLWDLLNDQPLVEMGKQDPDGNKVYNIRLSENGLYAISATQQNFAIWDLTWGQAQGLWSISDGAIRDVDIANNGEHVLLGLTNGKAIYINVATGRRMEFLAHREKVNTVAISPNGRYALSGGNDYIAYLWDTQTGLAMHRFEHENRVNRVALQRDGKLAFTSDGGSDSFIWDLTNGEKVSDLSTIVRQQVYSAARFSASGDRLITGTPSSKVMLWDSYSGKKLQSWEVEPLKESRPPAAVVYDVAFDPRGRVISATSAGIAQAWKVEP
jgi:WD40 repeat protein